MTIPIYVIALKSATTRRAEMTRRLNKLGLKFSFIDAVVGRDISAAETKSHTDPNRQYKTPSPLSAGSLGCALSHMAVWETIANAPAPFGFILEDDAVLSDDVPQLLARLERLTGKIDIVNLHFRGGKPLIDVAQLSPTHRLTSCRYNNFGAESYIISRDAAVRLLAVAKPISYEVDLFANRWWDHGVQMLTINPPVAHEDGSASTIGYPPSPPPWPNDTRIHYLRRKIHRIWGSIQKRRGYSSMVKSMKMRLLEPSDRSNNPAFPNLIKMTDSE